MTALNITTGQQLVQPTFPWPLAWTRLLLLTWLNLLKSFATLSSRFFATFSSHSQTSICLSTRTRFIHNISFHHNIRTISFGNIRQRINWPRSNTIAHCGSRNTGKRWFSSRIPWCHSIGSTATSRRQKQIFRHVVRRQCRFQTYSTSKVDHLISTETRSRMTGWIQFEIFFLQTFRWLTA